MSNSTCKIGVDVGGTKIEAIVLNADNDIIARRRIDTPKSAYDATLDAICKLIHQVEREAGLDHNLPVGLGTPGAVSLKTGLMKNSNSTILNGRPLPGDLESRLRRPVRISNDANCFTLSEATDGAASDAGNVFGVILGTGVGGGICIDGNLLYGVNAIAGEWGHTTLPLAGYQREDTETIDVPQPGYRRCFCGRFDCLETWLSGTGFERSYRELTDQQQHAADIIQRMESGEEAASALFDQYCNLLALALSTVINILDPDVIVAGGGMSNVDKIYTAVPAQWTKYVFSDYVSTRFVKAQHGDSSGVRGAAWLWPHANDFANTRAQH
ncbi:MAG: ROK family protein [Pseudomonadales bacterium]